ncbi:hypothetical protein [Candidatus Berkiella aquae]|uniref:Uncharacterized protein n=1 Tax=Candidatus Berkiella aquae TaxID=295108 RepID=A0A0Q9YK87_9GAMM|nr:hypothetical protein [Candidatus Berkiella aquae]MCS5711223.1 hypothetical protein [Candidatus Berkiella aquae]
MMKNLYAYNKFLQALEKRSSGGLFFHRINEQIYITDFTHKLLGIWDLMEGTVIDWRPPKASNTSCRQ